MKRDTKEETQGRDKNVLEITVHSIKIHFTGGKETFKLGRKSFRTVVKAYSIYGKERRRIIQRVMDKWRFEQN